MVSLIVAVIVAMIMPPVHSSRCLMTRLAPSEDWFWQPQALPWPDTRLEPIKLLAPGEGGSGGACGEGRSAPASSPLF